MGLLGNLIVRLITIAFGLMLANLAASIFLASGFFNETYVQTHGHMDHGFSPIWVVVFAGFTASLVLFPYLLGPAGILIAIAELMRWRSLTINLVLGGVCALFMGSLSGERDISDGSLVVLLAAGFVGGFAYWLVAGRSAGKWMPPAAHSSDKQN